MSGKFYSVTELKLLAEKNRATDLIIDGISIEDTENITYKSICYFTCNCGSTHNKTIKSIKQNKSKLLCKKCTQNFAKEKYKKTCLEKYGVENAFQSKEIKEKIQSTFINKYGVGHCSQSQEIKDKIKKTCIEKYGVENVSKVKEVREKKIVTCLEKRGVEHPTQSQEVKDKMKATNLERYGVEKTFQSQEIRNKCKDTCMEKYGVEYPMHNKKVFDKCQTSVFKKKEYTFKTGDIVLCQGFEPYALKDLETYFNYNFQDYENWSNFEFWYAINDKSHRYYPDIPFLRENLVIEVKSTYTFYRDIIINLEKAKCVINSNLEFEFWIFSKNGKNKQILNSSSINNRIKLHEELVSYFEGLNA